MDTTIATLGFVSSALLFIQGIWSLFSRVPLLQYLKTKVGSSASQIVAVLFVCLALVMWASFLLQEFGVISGDLEHVEDKIFRQERVVLDGKRYLRCTFQDVTFVYNGRPGEMHHTKIIGSIRFDISGNREISRMVYMMQRLGLLAEGSRFNDVNRGIITRAGEQH